MAKDIELGLKITAFDGATRALGRINRSLNRLTRRNRGLQTLAVTADRASKSLNSLGAGALTRITAPLVAGGGLALYAAGELEKLEVQMESLLGDSAEAKRMVATLADFTARTPFQLTEVGDATRQLLAAGVAVEDVEEELRVLGDVAAGAGKPINEMAAIYAKSFGRGKAQAEELNQLLDAGVPIVGALVELAEKYGNTISRKDVYDAAARGDLQFRHLREALGLLTSEGGVFENQMEKQSKTLFGRFSTLKDNIFLLTAEIGQQLEDTFSVKGNMLGLTDWIQGLTTDFRTFRNENPETADLLVKIAGGAAVLGPGLIGLGIGMKAISLGLGGLSFVLNPLGLAIMGIALAGAALWYFWDDIGPAWDRGIADMRSKWDEFTAYIRGDSEKTLAEVMRGEPHPTATEAFEDVHGKPDPSVGEVTEQTFGGLIDAWNNTFAWIEANTPEPLQFLNEPIELGPWITRQKSAWRMALDDLGDWFGRNTRAIFGDTVTDFLFGADFGRALKVPATTALGAMVDEAARNRPHIFSWVQEAWDDLDIGDVSLSIPAPIEDAWGWLQDQWDALAVGDVSLSMPAPVEDAWGWLQRQWNALHRGRLSLSMPAPVEDAWGWLQRQWDALKVGDVSLSMPAPVEDAWGWLQRQWDALKVGDVSLSMPAPVEDAWGWLQRQWDALKVGDDAERDIADRECVPLVLQPAPCILDRGRNAEGDIAHLEGVPLALQPAPGILDRGRSRSACRPRSRMHGAGCSASGTPSRWAMSPSAFRPRSRMHGAGCSASGTPSRWAMSRSAFRPRSRMPGAGCSASGTPSRWAMSPSAFRPRSRMHGAGCRTSGTHSRSAMSRSACRPRSRTPGAGCRTSGTPSRWAMSPSAFRPRSRMPGAGCRTSGTHSRSATSRSA